MDIICNYLAEYSCRYLMCVLRLLLKTISKFRAICDIKNLSAVVQPVIIIFEQVSCVFIFFLMVDGVHTVLTKSAIHTITTF